jgi:hypothetical protein
MSRRRRLSATEGSTHLAIEGSTHTSQPVTGTPPIDINAALERTSAFETTPCVKRPQHSTTHNCHNCFVFPF